MNTSNYLNLSYEQKLNRVSALQSMRALLKSRSKKIKSKKLSSKKRSRKRKMVFFNDNIEKIFHSMSAEAQSFIMNGGK